jgi:cytoskeleton protein RodZ
VLPNPFAGREAAEAGAGPGPATSSEGIAPPSTAASSPNAAPQSTIASPSTSAPSPTNTPPAAAAAAPATGATATSGAPATAGSVGSISVAQSAASAGAPLVLKFDGASWVEVRDASGRVILKATEAAGTTRSVDGNPPFQLTLGDAPKVAVTFRGQPLDLGPYTRGDVARVTLK